MVVKADDNSPIGLTYLQKVDLRNGNAEFSFYLGEPKYYSKGYAVEMELATLEYAFNHLNLHKVYAEVLEGGDRIISLHEKFNFKISGNFKEHIFHEGRHIGLIRVEVLKKDFMEIAPRIKGLCDKM